MNERTVVLDMLVELEQEDGYADRLIKDTLDKYDYLDSRDKSFIKRLTEGTVEKRITLDYIIDSFSKCKTKKMRPVIRQIMRMGAYQILFMDSVPDSAACNEAVKLAEKKGFSSLKGFVNGVLRSIARNQNQIKYPDPEKDWENDMSVEHSIPQDTVKLIEGWYGREKTKMILSDFDVVRPLTIRVCDSERFKDLLKTAEWKELSPEQSPYLPYCYTIKGAEGITSVPGFGEGVFTVQDMSSMLVTEAAGIKAGQFLLDVCAAPGGKSCQCAQRLVSESDNGDEKIGHLTACDISEERAERINENVKRMNIKCMDVRVCDACEFIPEFENKADILFADVPCSGLGVAGRKADIKYHVSQDSIDTLRELQWKIVSNVCRYVRPGGTMIYSTCTISPDENKDMVQKMVSELPLETETMEGRLPQRLISALDDNTLKDVRKGSLQLLPGMVGSDGFFIARLRKKM